MCGAISAATTAPIAAPSTRTMSRDLAKAGAMLPLRRLCDHPQAEHACGRAGGEPAYVVARVVHRDHTLLVEPLVDLLHALLHRLRVERLSERPHGHRGNEALHHPVRRFYRFHTP